MAKSVYIDTSIILSQLLREQSIHNLDHLEGNLLTCEISDLECRRTLDRIRHQEHLSDEEVANRLTELNLILQSIQVIQLNTGILKRAKAPYPTVVRSLDAIHLASAELSKATDFLTLDKQQSIAARALGFKTV